MAALGRPSGRHAGEIGAASPGGIVAAILLATVVPGHAFAQAGPTALTRLDRAIRFDGRVDDEAWDAVEPLPLTLYTPVYRGRPSEATEIRLAYDDDYLYAAGRFFDSDVDGIRVNSLYRDRWSGDSAVTRHRTCDTPY